MEVDELPERPVNEFLLLLLVGVVYLVDDRPLLVLLALFEGLH